MELEIRALTPPPPDPGPRRKLPSPLKVFGASVAVGLTTGLIYRFLPEPWRPVYTAALNATTIAAVLVFAAAAWYDVRHTKRLIRCLEFHATMLAAVNQFGEDVRAGRVPMPAEPRDKEERTWGPRRGEA